MHWGGGQNRDEEEDKHCVGMLREEGRHAVSKIIENERKKCYTVFLGGRLREMEIVVFILMIYKMEG